MKLCKVLAIGVLFSGLMCQKSLAATPEQQGNYEGVVTLNSINLGTGKIDKSQFSVGAFIAADDKMNLSIGAVNYFNIPAAIGVKHGGFSFTNGAWKHGSVIFQFVGKGKAIKGLVQYADPLSLQTMKFKLKKV